MRPRRTRSWLLIGILVCGVVLAAVIGPTLMYRMILWAWTGQTHDVAMTPHAPIGLVPKGVAAQTLAGHKGGTRALAFFPDGKHLASGGDDHIIRIWDLERHTSRAVEGHDGPVYALAISPDGRRMVSAGADLVARLWDVSSGKVLALLEGHTASIRAVAFLPNDRALTASDDGTLRMWNLRDEQQLKQLEGHENAVQGMSVSADGTRAASVDADGMVCLWDLNRGERVWSFRLAADEEPAAAQPIVPTVPAALVFSSDGQKLWTLYGRLEAATVNGWDVATRKPLPGWESAMRANYLRLSADGQHLLIVIEDEANVYRAMASDQPEYQARVNNPVAGPTLSQQDFQALATQPADGGKEMPEALRKLFADGIRQAELMPHPCAAAISADGNRVAVGLQQGLLVTPQSRSIDTPMPGKIVIFDRPR